VERIAENLADPAVGAVYFEQPTSGIVYVAAAAGCGRLDPEAIRLMPFFCHAFGRIGTTRRDYTEVARRIDAVTGGVGLSAHARTGFDGAGACIPFVALSAKSLLRNLTPMFDIVAELLACLDFSDTARLKNLLLEYRSGLESMIVPNGHRLAISLASRRFSAARAWGEEWSGVHQLLAAKRLTEDLSEGRLGQVAADLDRLGKRVFGRSNVGLAVIGEADAIAAARKGAGGILGGLADGEAGGFKAPDVDLPDPEVREGWSTAAAVNFVAAAFPAVRLPHDDAAALAVIAKLLRSLYLHREIREKGGAYGGFALYNSEDGLFSLASYRDPHIAATLDVFQGAADFICRGAFDENDVKEAILQVCSEIDKPDPPGPAARKAFFRKIVSLSDDLRARFKQRVIALSRRDVMQAAERYFGEGLPHCSVAVIGSEESLREANERLKEPLAIFKI
jgi:Zn-dependent M16 (insulinase) family peptidase